VSRFITASTANLSRNKNGEQSNYNQGEYFHPYSPIVFSVLNDQVFQASSAKI